VHTKTLTTTVAQLLFIGAGHFWTLLLLLLLLLLL
jgi:hypothetical protein